MTTRTFPIDRPATKDSSFHSGDRATTTEQAVAWLHYVVALADVHGTTSYEVEIDTLRALAHALKGEN